jgi:hypothetical protein
VPLRHASPGLHVLPHPPQFVGSVRTSTHWSLHSFVSLPQAHAPSKHAVDEPQAWLHEPQLFGSVERSAQAPLQLV